MIALSDSAPKTMATNDDLATFVLAAGIALDLTIKEEKG